jgi:hypothetical protein
MIAINKDKASQQITQQAKSAVYALLDQTAQKYDYRNFAEVAQFVNSSEWKAEVEALLVWQDAVWTKAYELLKTPIISVDEFMVQLPKYVQANKQGVGSITPRQIRLYLTEIGLRQVVENYVGSSNQDIKDWWEFSTSIERTSPLLITAATQLGLYSEQLDQFFLEASKL